MNMFSEIDQTIRQSNKRTKRTVSHYLKEETIEKIKELARVYSVSTNVLIDSVFANIHLEDMRDWLRKGIENDES